MDSKFDELNKKQANIPVKTTDDVRTKFQHVQRPKLTRMQAYHKNSSFLKNLFSKQTGRSKLLAFQKKRSQRQTVFSKLLANAHSLAKVIENQREYLRMYNDPLYLHEPEPSLLKKAKTFISGASYNLDTPTKDGLIFHQDKNGIYYTTTKDRTFEIVDSNNMQRTIKMAAGSSSGYIKAHGKKARQYLSDLTAGKIKLNTYIDPKSTVSLKGNVSGFDKNNLILGQSKVNLTDASIDNVRSSNAVLTAHGKQTNLNLQDSTARLYNDTADCNIYDSKVNLSRPSHNWSCYGSSIHNIDKTISDSYIENAEIYDTDVDKSHIINGEYSNSSATNSLLIASLDTTFDNTFIDQTKLTSAQTRTASLHVRDSTISESVLDLESNKEFNIRYAQIKHGLGVDDIDLTASDLSSDTVKLLADTTLEKVKINEPEKALDLRNLLQELDKIQNLKADKTRLVDPEIAYSLMTQKSDKRKKELAHITVPTTKLVSTESKVTDKSKSSNKDQDMSFEL